MVNLTLMVGIPGVGKSTAAAKMAQEENTLWVSRDTIRFSMVAENEEYFSREAEVFDTFAREIAARLFCGYNVVADATHITVKSRAKTINAVKHGLKLMSGNENYLEENVELQACVVRKSLEKTLEQNENRRGTRSYVPKSVIRRMNEQFEDISTEENFKTVIRIKEKDDNE